MSLTKIFCTRAVKWRDLSGSQRASAKFFDIEVPNDTATHALAIGAAVRVDDPLRRENNGRYPGRFNVSECFDLNEKAAS
jgi:hypothetical protein